MHSYETLAVLALAVSTASPALSAPLQENQQQARAGAAPAAAGGIGSILKTIATGVGFGALPVVLQDVLGGNSARRALARDFLEDATPPAHVACDGLPVGLNERGVFDSLVNGLKSSDSIGKVLGTGLLSGVASGVGAVGANELLNKREPSPLSASDLSGIGKTIAGTLVSLAAADGVKELITRDSDKSHDLVDILQLLGREFDERGIFDSLVNGLKSSDSIGKVLGNGLLSGVASGVGAVGANELLNKREPSPLSASDLSGIGKTVAGTLASLAAATGINELLTRDDASSQDLVDILQLLAGRHFDERGQFDSLLNHVDGLGSSDTIGTVLGTGPLGGVASGVGANQLLNLNNRRELEALD